jgi:hypothetical protein
VATAKLETAEVKEMYQRKMLVGYPVVLIELMKPKGRELYSVKFDSTLPEGVFAFGSCILCNF